MNKLVEVKDNRNEIESKIHNVRGKLVILDSDLAKIYECNNGTKQINQAVKRNIERFPDDFCFQVSKEELLDLRSQTVTSSLNEHGGLRYLPYAFTQEGVAMLASCLRTDVAKRVSVSVMRAFVKMKDILMYNLESQRKINELVIENSKQLSTLNRKVLKHDILIEQILSNFNEKNNHIYFSGQFYDAYSLMMDILSKSKKNIIIIDNYIDKSLLDILKGTNKDILIVTNKYNNTDYNKYKKQYSNITLQIENDIHDRFIIIDKKILYHCGASFKDLGNKCFSINLIDSDALLNDLINRYNL